MYFFRLYMTKNTSQKILFLYYLKTNVCDSPIMIPIFLLLENLGSSRPRKYSLLHGK
jgi:hypothetical protein